MTSLTVPFRLRGSDGVIEVEVSPNDDPVRWGCDLLDPSLPPDAALGYPVCLARVRYGRQGYAAALGWLQVVRSTDGEEGPDVFSLDPVTLYRDVATPYAFFGIRPRFFDAPFRETREPLTWRAQTFLCFTPDAVMTREVHPLAGFGWGFDVADGEVSLLAPYLLEAGAWDAHLASLRPRFPDWRFVDG